MSECPCSRYASWFTRGYASVGTECVRLTVEKSEMLSAHAEPGITPTPQSMARASARDVGALHEKGLCLKSAATALLSRWPAEPAESSAAYAA